MELLTRTAEKLGSLGSLVSAASFGQWWTARLLYTGLAFMVGVSL